MWVDVTTGHPVRNAFLRIVNQAGGDELARDDLTEDASSETTMVVGELDGTSGEGTSRAAGQGYSAGLEGIHSASGSPSAGWVVVLMPPLDGQSRLWAQPHWYTQR